MVVRADVEVDHGVVNLDVNDLVNRPDQGIKMMTCTSCTMWNGF